MISILNNIRHTDAFHSLDDYATAPCEVFLSEIYSIYSSVKLCADHLPPTNKLTENALTQISIAALGTIMGQFELYQRFTFSAAFELTRYISSFNLESSIKTLEKDAGLQLDIAHLCAYRGQPAPIGQLIADSLMSWHSPEKVNLYVRAIARDLAFYSNDDIRIIKALWQIRHSMVHTGGWLTLPDAQKNVDFSGQGGKAIFFEDDFTEALVKALFKISISATRRLSVSLEAAIPADVAASKEFMRFASTKTNKRSWVPSDASA